MKIIRLSSLSINPAHFDNKLRQCHNILFCCAGRPEMGVFVQFAKVFKTQINQT